MNVKDMGNEQYGLLFDVRRSMRYHDRRYAFFDRMHRLTNLLTILMAGSVLYDLGKTGEAAWWLTVLGAVAALLAALDMVLGYSGRATLHRDLKSRFAQLEIDMLIGSEAAETWNAHQMKRLAIERDEPPIYRVVDSLCRNEQLRAEGIDDPRQFDTVGWWQRCTSHLWLWSDLGRKSPEAEAA